MQVSEFLRLTRTLLFDPAPGAGWTDVELVDHLNLTQRRVCFVKPDSYTKQVVIGLAVGATQNLPTDAVALIDVVGNGVTGATVTQVNEELLKAANRAFRTTTPDTAIENYSTDPRNPRRFLVTPPAAPGATLEIVYGAVPPDLSKSQLTASTVLPASFDAVLIDGVLSLAYSKPGRRQDLNKAAGYLSLFNAAIGVKDKMQQIIAPKVGQ